MLRKKIYIHPNNDDSFKSFGYVKNSVYIIYKLLTNNLLASGNTFYLCDYNSIELYDWIDRLCKSMNVSSPARIPKSLAVFSSYIASNLIRLKLLPTSFPLTSRRIKNITSSYVYNTDDLFNFVGELPYSLDEAVHETTSWFNNNY